MRKECRAMPGNSAIIISFKLLTNIYSYSSIYKQKKYLYILLYCIYLYETPKIVSLLRLIEIKALHIQQGKYGKS